MQSTDTPASPRLPLPPERVSGHTLGVIRAIQHAPVCWTLPSQHPLLHPAPVKAASVLHGAGLHGPLLLLQAVLQGVPAPPLKLLSACRTLCLPERLFPTRLHSISTALPIAVTAVFSVGPKPPNNIGMLLATYAGSHADACDLM